jgi:hypothetical protein
MAIANPKEYGSYKAFGAQRRSQPVMAPKNTKSDSNGNDKSSHHPKESENMAGEAGRYSGEHGETSDDDDEGAVSQEVLLAIALQKSKHRQAGNRSVATSARPPKSQSLGPSGTQAIADRMNGAVSKISDILASPLVSRNNALFGKTAGDSTADAGSFETTQRQVPQSPVMRTPVGVKRSILSSSLHGNDPSRRTLDPNMNLSARSDHSTATSSSLFDGVADAAQRLSGLLMSPKTGQDTANSSEHKSSRPAGMPPRSPTKSPHSKHPEAHAGRQNLVAAPMTTSDRSSSSVPKNKSDSLRNLLAGSNTSNNNNTGGSLRNLLSGGTGGSLRNLFSSSSHGSTSGSAQQNSIKSDAGYFAQGINLASLHASEHSDGSRENEKCDDNEDSFHGDGEEEEAPLSAWSLKRAFQVPATTREKEHDNSMGSLCNSPHSRDEQSRTSFLDSVGDLPFGDDR